MLFDGKTNMPAFFGGFHVKIRMIFGQLFRRTGRSEDRIILGVTKQRWNLNPRYKVHGRSLPIKILGIFVAIDRRRIKLVKITPGFDLFKFG